MTSRAFDSKAEVAPNYQYVGPILDDPPCTEAWQSPWSSDSLDPLVVVSLSTTYQHQEDALQKVLDALDGLKVRVLVTLGPTLAQTQFRIPANVVVRQSVPHTGFPIDISSGESWWAWNGNASIGEWCTTGMYSLWARPA